MKNEVLIGLILFMYSCTSVPENVQTSFDPIEITPDYQNLVIPCNIAPLNFKIETEADAYLTRISAPNGREMLCDGQYVQMDVDDWHALLAQNKDEKLKIEVFTKQNGVWRKHPAMSNLISADSIDGYLSYRLIEPSYEYFGELSIRQRNLSNFDECDIYNNRMLYEGRSTQCINCHAFQNYRTDRMQFHIRAYKGCTVIANDGNLEKVNIKTDSLISNGVYPAWHPTEALIAYSVNATRQIFHSKNIQKIEVMDSKSDLVLYDVNKHQTTVIQNDTNVLETFPAWSPDGRWLYYAAASLHSFNPKPKTFDEIIAVYDRIHYDLFRLSFDPFTHTFGTPEKIYDATAINQSAALPRISPDGRYLLFSMGKYGTFHIWHRSSDLYLTDLSTRETRKLENVNSGDTESYHAWSSNGRWLVFSSRRDDGSYTRPYIAYFDRNGQAHRPFIVPQRDPDYYLNLFKSFNIPEFTVEPVKISPKEFAKIVEQS